MAKKLKNLKVKKVDFVDAGANPAAHVLLYKSKEGTGELQGEPPKQDSILKRFLSAIGKAVGMKPEDIEATVEEIEKVRAEEDEEVLEKEKEGKRCKTEKAKGEKIMIDKSLLNAEERAFLESLEKRFSGAEEPIEKSIPVVMAPNPVNLPPVPANRAEETTEGQDIYKGLHPAVAEELKMLRKRADEAEEKELTEIAKKYELIGKKPEELVPVLKSLKTADVDAYTNMIAILDASVEAVNKSSLFAEIGKSTGYRASESDAWTKIEKKADEIQTGKPELARFEAIDLACKQNPQLVREYESE